MQVEDESGLAGTRAGHLADLFRVAGLRRIEQAVLSVSREYADFEEWWEPFTGGVGPAGAYVARLDTHRRAELRDQCLSMLPVGPITITARAWAARGTT
jgi:hypothetical protein